jgi:hypothetical protein
MSRSEGSESREVSRVMRQASFKNTVPLVIVTVIVIWLCMQAVRMM